MNRRTFLQSAASLSAALAVSEATAASEVEKPYQDGTSPWPLCINTSTIRPAPVREKISAAADAGYDALELWTQDLDQWVESGATLTDLRNEIRDRGMFVINVIGLWDCMPQDSTEYASALDLSKKRMAMASEAGSRHIAVLPLPDRSPFDLHYATEKYRELLELGLNEYDIQPAMEFVSVFKGIRRLGEAVQIAIDADHPKACVIPDTFHLYNGGSGFAGLQHVPGHLIASFHWNDLPAGLDPGALKDAQRIVPGQGALPLVESLRVLLQTGYRGPLSLELFDRSLWEMDPTQAARIGIEGMRKNVADALAAD